MYNDNPGVNISSDHPDFDQPNQSDEENGIDPEFLDMVDIEYDLQEDQDLYAILGVDRNATESDLKSAYRKMSKNFHPDKRNINSHPSNTEEDPLNVAFTKISNAYRILTDPRQRKIYDSYGLSGLNNYKWDLSIDHENPAKLRLEYIRLRNKELENKMTEITQPNSTFEMSLDVRDLFDRYLLTDASALDGDDNPILIDPPDIHVFQAFINQSIILGISMSHQFKISASVISYKGIGLNNLDLSWDYQSRHNSYLKGALLKTTLSHGKRGCLMSIGQRIQRLFYQRFSLYASYDFGFKHNGEILSLVPTMSVGTNIELAPNLVGSVQYTALVNGGLVASINYNTSKYSLGLRGFTHNHLNAGIGFNIGRSVDWPILSAPIGTSRFDDAWVSSERKKDIPSWADPDEYRVFDEWTGRTRKGFVFADLNFTTNDLVKASFGARCFIARYSQMSFRFTISLIKGLTMRIDIFRGSQTYSIPIILSQDYNNLGALGYGLSIPIISFISFRYLLYEPWLKKELYRAEKYRRNKLSNELVKKRQSANAIQNTLAFSSAKIREHEESIGGLVIVKALYGLLDRDNPLDKVLIDEGGPLSIDVTIPIQTMVQNSQIILAPIKMSNLQGFYDPAIGLNISANSNERNSGNERQIVIKYYFHKKLHLVCTNESSGLAIPMTKHLI